MTFKKTINGISVNFPGFPVNNNAKSVGGYAGKYVNRLRQFQEPVASNQFAKGLIRIDDSVVTDVR